MPTESWTTGEHIVDNVLTFYCRPPCPTEPIKSASGSLMGQQRAVLYGNNDGNLRYTVGRITVADNGSSITYTAIPITIPDPDPRLNSSGSVMDFGTVRTDGMVLLQQQTGQNSDSVRISSYPRSRDVVVQINSKTVATPPSVTCDNGDVLVPSIVAPYWQIDLRGRKYCTWSGKLP